MYAVQHYITHEPCGHSYFPDKEFETYDDARNYYAKQWRECKKKAKKALKEFPLLYDSEEMRKDLFHDETFSESWIIEGFVFHENYSYHQWSIIEL